MSTYLERLKSKTGEKHLTHPPSKPSKDSEQSSLHVSNVLKATSACAFDANAAATDVFEERAALCEYDGGLARDHAEQVAALHAAPMPEGITERQRCLVIDAAARFLDRQRR